MKQRLHGPQIESRDASLRCACLHKFGIRIILDNLLASLRQKGRDESGLDDVRTARDSQPIHEEIGVRGSSCRASDK